MNPLSVSLLYQIHDHPSIFPTGLWLHYIDSLGCNDNNPGNHQWGTPETIASIQTLGAQWNKLGYESDYGKINIGDISLQNGGVFPPHGSHQNGIDADISTAGLDQEATRKLIKTILDTGEVQLIFYNDATMINEFSKVSYWVGHDDHLHVRYVK